MCEPISLGAKFASIGSAFKFADLAVRIGEVSSENAVFLRTIHNIRDDLNEVERLMNSASVQQRLASTPGKGPWISRSINNTKAALNEIGKWVERARAEHQSTGDIQFKTRIRWVFNDHEKLLNRTTELTTCHQKLSTVLHYLVPLEGTSPGLVQPTHKEIIYYDEILSRHKKKLIGHIPPVEHGAKAVDELLRIAGSHVLLTSEPMAQHTVAAHQPIGSENYNAKLDYNASVSALSHSRSSVSSPPSSPPPSYSSVVRSPIEPSCGSPNPRRQSRPMQSIHGRNRSIADSIYCARTVTSSSDDKSSWAYEHTSDDWPNANFDGDTVDMSATNFLGPVNPYEYNTSMPIKFRAPHVTREMKDVVEMLGDINFAVELPSNDPGPPPGYPPRTSRNSMPHPRNNLYTHHIHTSEQRCSVTELPAFPNRRPIMSHTASEPIHTAHELSSASFFPDSHLKPRLEMSRSGTGCQYSARHQSSPTFVIHQAPSSTRLESAQFASPKLRRKSATELYDPAINAVPLPESAQPEHSASSARMHRQKQIMDFLGSIE